VTTFGGNYDDALADGVGHEPIGVADVTGDGRADYVSFYRPLGLVFTYPGLSDGRLGAGVSSFAGPSGGTMVSNLFDGRAGSGHELATVVDVDGNGRSDLVSAYQDGKVYVYPGFPNGAFGVGVASFGGTFASARFNQSPAHEIAAEKPALRRRGCAPTGCG
jgi:hypothetical protein